MRIILKSDFSLFAVLFCTVLSARNYFKQMLELNPQFDPRQSAIAKTLFENR